MAPKGMKRPAAFDAGGATKKAADSKVTMCADVVAEISNADELPKSCRCMLAGMLKECLTVYAADRHPYEVRAVDMASEALATIRARLEQELASAQTQVENAGVEKEGRNAVLSVATARLAELEQAVKSAEEAVSADAGAERGAKSSLAQASSALQAKEAELAAVEQKKAKFESILKEGYNPLKASKASGKDGLKALSTLQQALKGFGVEQSLLNSLAETLKKDSESRGTFDGITIQEVESQMKLRDAELEASIKERQSVKQVESAAKAAAETVYHDAAAALEKSKKALADAEAAKSEASKNLKLAKAAVANYFQDVKGSALRFDEAKSALAAFVDGPLKALEQLKDLAPAPEAPEDAAEEEEQEAANAEDDEAPAADQE